MKKDMVIKFREDLNKAKSFDNAIQSMIEFGFSSDSKLVQVYYDIYDTLLEEYADKYNLNELQREQFYYFIFDKEFGENNKTEYEPEYNSISTFIAYVSSNWV
jgi:hypothetical protein